MSPRYPVARTRQRPRLGLEAFEPRHLPAAAGAVLETDLVADQPGVARLTDPNLVNGWGISLSPDGGTFWVSDNGTGKSSLYGGDVNGTPLSVNPLVVDVPGGAPTGQVFNGTSDFVVHSGTASAPALFVFASEAGQITGWNPAVPPPTPSMTAQPAFTSPAAVYKGLAIGSNSRGNFLYAADFHGNRIDVLDKAFAPATLAGNFTDPNLPAGFAPFNIQNLGGKLYVAYAVQDDARHDEVDGAGLGLVDVFDTDGRFLSRVATGGSLNAPWGLALAPAGFGGFGGDLLVGNFGDGRISAFDPTTGAFKGMLTDPSGKQVQIDGLWGMAFGNGKTAGDPNTLYFAAGPGDEQHGLFGSLRAVPSQRGHVEAVGADAGGGPRVQVFDPATGAVRFDFFAFEPTFTGGVRVAVGDVTGDGIDDVVVAAGKGGGPRVQVFDGVTGQVVRSFFAFEPSFTGGLSVAVGDVNGDGSADVVVGAGAGGGPHVTVFGGRDGSVLRDFFAFDPAFRGGVTVAAADTNGDGKAEVVTGAGSGGGPAVRVFDGAAGQVVRSFFAFAPTFTGGVNVGAGDVDGDGRADVIVGAGAGGGPAVGVFDAASGAQQSSFFAFDPSFTGGVRVAAADLTGDGTADLILGPGRGGGPDVRVRDGRGEVEAGERGDFFGMDPAFRGGVFVG